jgi:murein DD-endopeptidase MepM/ murein hydrolase activator NlpD
MDIKIGKPFSGKAIISMKFAEAPKWYTDIAGYPHNGVDFAMEDGREIRAAHDGKITYADNVPDSNGLGINLGAENFFTQYWHLSSIIAKMGVVVKRGEPLGFSGHSGWATGPHLHFGIKIPGDGASGMRGWADPLLFIEDTDLEPVTLPANNKKYLVLPGDSLWKIAKKFYGVGDAWPKIYEANRLQIANPNLIRAFQVLDIP